MYAWLWQRKNMMKEKTMNKRIKILAGTVLSLLLVVFASGSVMAYAEGEQDSPVYSLTIRYVCEETVLDEFTETYETGQDVSGAPFVFPETIEYEGVTYVLKDDDTEYGEEGMIWEYEENISIDVQYSPSDDFATSGNVTEQIPPVEGGDAAEDTDETETVIKKENTLPEVKNAAADSHLFMPDASQAKLKDVNITVLGTEEVPLASLDFLNEEFCLLHVILFGIGIIALVVFAVINGRLRRRISELRSRMN